MITENTQNNRSNNNKVFDRDNLLERLGGDEDFFDELISLFLEETSTLICSLEDGIKKKDNELVHRMAHTIKGSSANVCANNLQEAGLKLEMAANNGEFNKAPKMLKTIKNEFEKLKKVFGVTEEAVI